MSWGHWVDMWSIGLLVWLSSTFSFQYLTYLIKQAWDLLQPESLFHLYDANDPALNEAHHLANMTALLGLPPLEFLRRSTKSNEYWDENGKAKTSFV